MKQERKKLIIAATLGGILVMATLAIAVPRFATVAGEPDELTLLKTENANLKAQLEGQTPLLWQAYNLEYHVCKMKGHDTDFVTTENRQEGTEYITELYCHVDGEDVHHYTLRYDPFNRTDSFRVDPGELQGPSVSS